MQDPTSATPIPYEHLDAMPLYELENILRTEMQDKTPDLGLISYILSLNILDLNAYPDDLPSLLMITVSKGHLDIMRLLMQHGADPSFDPDIFIIAITKKRVEMLEEILKFPIDLNLSDGLGKTPLMWAVSSKASPEIIRITRMLIEHGAGVEVEDAWGRTPKACATEEFAKALPEYFAQC